MGLAIVSFGVYLVLAAVPGTQNPTAAPPGDDVSWYPPLYVNPTTNRVGIGTNNPLTVLHVADPGLNQGIILDTTNTRFRLYEDSDTPNWIRFRPVTGNGFMFSNNGDTARMVILESGNVGIGTANPTQRLDVNGNITASGTIQGLKILGYGKTTFNSPGGASIICKAINFSPGWDTNKIFPINSMINAFDAAWKHWTVHFENIDGAAGTTTVCISSGGGYSGVVTTETVSYIIYGYN